MEPLLQEFYDYLKEEYGVKNTERINSQETIHCDIQIDVPGFRKNNPKHYWTVHLEESSNSFSLIIGEHWPSEGHSWSRYIEIEKYHDTVNYKFYLLKIIQNMFFKKDYDFETLRVFTNIAEAFFSEKLVVAE